MDAPETAALDPLMQALRFAAALGLGVLLGLERERSKTEATFAGVRTFALLALAGGVAGFLDEALHDPGLALAVFAAVAALVVVSYAVTSQRGAFGVTTEISALLAFLIGVLCLRGHVATAAGLAVASGAMLVLKDWLHRLSHRIEPGDVEATLKFAIVSLIVLPLVPNRELGPSPFDAINPYKIWLMVVLISGLDFASYVLAKVVGPEQGVALAGLLGGLVSSTATTLGLARRSREHPRQVAALALGMLIAWTVMFVRVGVLVAAVAWELGAKIAAAMASFAVPGLAICAFLWRRQQSAPSARASAGENPFALGQAIRFGAIFGVVTFVARAARVHFGDAGLYLAAGVAGLTDVDAIALSMAQLAHADQASASPALTAIVIAVSANTLCKAGMAVALGAPALRKTIVAATAAIVACAGLGLWLIR